MEPMVKIGNREIGPGHPCFIVGDIGINHNGDVDIALQLIERAADAGIDAVKFQKRTVSVVYSEGERAKPREVPPPLIQTALARGVLSADAVARLTSSGFKNTTNGDLKHALELTEAEYRRVDAHCKNRGILWFASPWDEGSVDFLARFDPPCYKIASASLTDDALLRDVRARGKPVILSTGMSTFDEIEHAVKVLGEKDLILLHCTSTYPSEDREVNLGVIQTLQKRFPSIPIGYSGHERGISLSVNAAAVGACVVERHITLDRSMWGSDQAASVEPRGLELLVRDIRRFEVGRGDGQKRVWESEVPVRQKLRRK